MKKIRVLYFLELQKFEKIKWSTFIIFGLQTEILTFCAFYQFTYLAKIACQKNSCSLKFALSFLK